MRQEQPAEFDRTSHSAHTIVAALALLALAAVSGAGAKGWLEPICPGGFRV